MAKRIGHLVEIGGVLTGLGGTFAAGYWIYAEQTENVALWSWEMWLAVSAGVLGLVLMAAGAIFDRDETAPAQVQRGGKGSRNYQAGRDLTVRMDGDDE